MLRISQLKLHVTHKEIDLFTKVQKLLKISASDIIKLEIKKQSIDARKKPDLYYVYTVDVEVKNEKQIMKQLRKRKMSEEITYAKSEYYVFPSEGEKSLQKRPVVIGCGPSGLFAAYFLAKYGYQPIVIERGASVEERMKDVEAFWETGILNPESNVQFGEGGAGTFSDGKLNTLVKDPSNRIRKVLEIFVENGAPADILYVNKPHIGTDILCEVIRNMREKIKDWGGEFHFHTCMTSICYEDDRLHGIEVTDAEGSRTISTDILILAPGHSARDTFQMLFDKQVPMEAKSFAVGFRVEHPQEVINISQYGAGYPDVLSAAAYKITAKTSKDRGVYSFCMCPGGHVVNASSEAGMLAVNGMSYHARDSKNANSAIIITVTPEDYPGTHVLAGVEFQRELERKAYEAGQGKIPVQTYGEFKFNVEQAEDSSEFDASIDVLFEQHEPCTKGDYVYSDLTDIFTEDMNQSFVEGMESFNKKIHGFSHPKALLLGVESRTSSPVRILRDENLESKIKGLYPAGEGAGFAGGITSAAVDGIKIAEKIRQSYKSFDNVPEL